MSEQHDNWYELHPAWGCSLLGCPQCRDAHDKRLREWADRVMVDYFTEQLREAVLASRIRS